ncbi:MAG: histidine kinase [Eubacteriales bacterium]|nr:histidine kinase [Eubacteriales bacterium]
MRIQKTDWGQIEWMDPEDFGEGQESSLRTGTVYVEPGKAMMKHVHYEEQFIYVLQGHGVGYINGQAQKFEPGARFHMPAGCTHEFVNTGDTTLVHLLVASPLSIDPDSLIDKTKPSHEKAEGQLYTAIEAVRTQFLENLNMAFVIRDAEGNVVLKSDYFPETCETHCCISGGGPCYCLRLDQNCQEASENTFVCPGGLTVFRVPIIWEEQRLGWVQGGYIRLSYGKDSPENMYDVPESGAFGILQLLRKVAKAIRNYCEFDQYRKELFETEKSLSSSLDVQRDLRLHLRDSEQEVADLKINNHFLFNTLNSMAAQALEGGMRPLYQSIIDLSKMLRYSVRVRGSQIPLAVELDYLEAYLKLQRLRYPVGFSYEIRVEPGLERAEVPFNFLQPVAENAFTHGFSSEKEKELFIRVESCGDGVQFLVENNGTLLTADRCRQIRAQIQSNTSHGLSMICEKLRSAYGTRFSMEILPGDRSGAKVRIRIPFKNWTQAEEEKHDQSSHM